MERKSTYTVGGKTAAFILLVTGLALLGEIMNLPAIVWLFNIWPVFFIVLGLEYFFTRQDVDGKTPQLAIKKIVTSLVISLVVITALQGWYFVADTLMGGNRTNLPEQTIYPSRQTDRIVLENRNGNARFESHNGDEVVIQAAIGGKRFGNFNSRSAAKQVDVRIEETGNAIEVEVEKPSFGFWFIQSRPSVHFTILLPEKREWDIEVDQRNGDVILDGVNVKDKARIQTTNGKVEASHLAGDLYLRSTNGHLKAHGISGVLDGRTTNGRIEISGAAEQIKARTTNGKLFVNSTLINGDWDLSTTNGSVELKLPAEGNFSLSGKTTNGSLSAQGPFEVDRRTIRGTVGSGFYQVEVSTTNGNFTVELQ